MADDDNLTTSIVISAVDNSTSVMKAVAEQMKQIGGSADELSKNFKRGVGTDIPAAWNLATKAVKDHGEASKAVFENLQKGLEGFSEELGDLPLSYEAAGGAAALFAADAYKSFASVQRSMERLQFQTGMSDAQIQKLKSTFEDLSAKTGVSLIELGRAYASFAATSGQSGETARRSFADIALAAHVAGASTEQMASAAGAVFSNLHIQSQKDKEAILGTWANDVPQNMQDAWLNMAPRITETMAAMGYSGVAAATQASAMFNQLAIALHQPRAAATALQNVFEKLEDPTSQIGARVQLLKPGTPLEAVKDLISVMEKLHAFGSDRNALRMRSMLGIDDDLYASVIRLRDNIGEVQKAAEEAGGAWAKTMKESELMSHDAQAAVDDLGAAFEAAKDAVGQFLDEIGAGRELRAFAATVEGLAKVMNALSTGNFKEVWQGLKDAGRGAANATLPPGIPNPLGAARDLYHDLPPDAADDNQTTAQRRAQGRDRERDARRGFQRESYVTEDATNKNTAALNRVTDVLRDPMRFGANGGPLVQNASYSDGGGDDGGDDGLLPPGVARANRARQEATIGRIEDGYEQWRRGARAALANRGSASAPGVSAENQFMEQYRRTRGLPHTASLAPNGGMPTNSGAVPRGRPFAQGSATTDAAIEAAAKHYGLDPNTLRSIASIESGMHPDSNANRATQYKGLFQIGRNEWAQYGGGGNIYSAHDNAMGAAHMLHDHAEWFKKRYGREPTDAELYMMHQQGRGFFSRNAMTNIQGNPYPGMHGPQTHDSFEAGWGNEIARRKRRFEAAHPQSSPSPPTTVQHSAPPSHVMDQVNKPVNINLRMPDRSQWRSRVTRQMNRWANEDVLGAARYGAPADIGLALTMLGVFGAPWMVHIASMLS